MSKNRIKITFTQGFCCACSKKDKKPAFNGVVAPFYFRDSVSRAVHRFKFYGYTELADNMAREMTNKINESFCDIGFDFVTFVPLSKRRYRKRGYNQAEIIAKCLSEKTGVSLVSDALFRVKKTTAQKKLDRQERMGNLRDAFALSERWKPVANVLLIDDIYTTGATVEQAAKILKKAGAQNVYFLTISIGQGI